MVNIVSGDFQLGWPRLSDSVVELFTDEYKLPLLSPLLSAVAEHVFPLFILLGLATRLSSFALLGMTLVIQLFVFPGAYATHGTWAAVLLYLMLYGPGHISADRWLAGRMAKPALTRWPAVRPAPGGCPQRCTCGLEST